MKRPSVRKTKTGPRNQTELDTKEEGDFDRTQVRLLGAVVGCLIIGAGGAESDDGDTAGEAVQEKLDRIAAKIRDGEACTAS